jgi:hypothetical protein
VFGDMPNVFAVSLILCPSSLYSIVLFRYFLSQLIGLFYHNSLLFQERLTIVPKTHPRGRKPALGTEKLEALKEASEYSERYNPCLNQRRTWAFDKHSGYQQDHTQQTGLSTI